jgi:hypothetical protein
VSIVRRREKVAKPATPPAELTDYLLWCRKRVLAPYGTAGDVKSMCRAAAQWRKWAQERTAWAVAHGQSERDMDISQRAEPWCADSI